MNRSLLILGVATALAAVGLFAVQRAAWSDVSNAAVADPEFTRGSLHVGRVLTAAGFQRALRGRRGGVPPGPPTTSDAEEENDSTPPPCISQCVFETVDVGKVTLNAPPAAILATGLGGIDPQVAASNAYVVVGLRDRLRFYDKSGAPLKNTDGSAISYPVPLCTIFQNLTPSINANLQLPSQLTDADGNAITVKNGYGLNCDAATGGTRPANWSHDRDNNGVIDDGDFYWPNGTYYDARVLFDETHKRFVIAALYLNNNTPYRKKDLDAPGSRSINVQAASRSGYAIAISITSDPRGGWYTYWFPAFDGAYACPAGCDESEHHWEERRADYVHMGISADLLAVEADTASVLKDPPVDPTKTTTTDDRPTVTLLPLGPLVAGTVCPCFYYQSRDFTYPDGVAVTAGAPLEPGVHHGTAANVFLLAHTYVDPDLPEQDRYRIAVWRLELQNDQVDVTSFSRSVRMFAGTGGAKAPQAGGAAWDIATWASPNSFAVRGDDLYLTWDECAEAAADICLRSGIRFVHLKPGGPVLEDETFGGSTLFDPPGTVGWYGLPALEVNKLGDVALIFNHSASTIFPTAAYTVRTAVGGYAPRASRALKSGSGTVGGWHHYVGAGLDPWDQTGIWVITGYGTPSGFRYVVGKIFGGKAPDLTLLKGGLSATGRRGVYTLTLTVRNQGDRRAPASTIAVHLNGTRGTLARFPLPALGSGKNSTAIHHLTVPGATATRTSHAVLRLTVDGGRSVKEYEETNNTRLVRLP